MTADNKHNEDSLEQKRKENDPNQDVEPQRENDTKPQENKKDN